MTEGIIIAGTGHRPKRLGGYSNKAFNVLVQVARKAIEDTKAVRVISGMALGFDQALATAALELHVDLIAAIPFVGQELAWPQSSRDKYASIINMAKELHVVSPGGFSPAKMQKRNEWMVDHCDILVALFSGAPSGTDKCIKYARGKNKKVVNYYDHWLSIK